MTVLLERLAAHQAAFDDLTDDELVTLVLQLAAEPWGNFRASVFEHAAPRLAQIVRDRDTVSA